MKTQNQDAPCSSITFGGCRPQKYLTDIRPSNISGVYNPQIFDGCTSVKYFGGVDPPNI